MGSQLLPQYLEATRLREHRRNKVKCRRDVRAPALSPIPLLDLAQPSDRATR